MWWYVRNLGSRQKFWLPEDIGALLGDLLGRSTVRLSRTVSTLRRQPDFFRSRVLQSRRSIGRFQGLPGLQTARGVARRSVPRIRKLPVYFVPPSWRRNVEVSIPAALPLVRPGMLPEQLPQLLPEVVLEPYAEPRFWQARGLPAPAAVIRTASAPASFIPEGSRRRRDTKIGGGYAAEQYRRALALVNRTYGSFDELREVWTAYQLNPTDPLGFLGANAVNQFVDLSIGLRAQLLRSQLYSSRAWPFPFGIGPLTRLWNLQ